MSPKKQAPSTPRGRRERSFPRAPGPAPRIINLLHTVVSVLWNPHPGEHERIAALDQVKAVLNCWEAHEDLDELRDVLGLNAKRGRRRMARTVQREYAIAFAYAEHRRRGAEAGVALRVVASEFAVTERTVERAHENWGPLVEGALKLASEHLGPNGIIVYSGLKPDKK